MSESRQKFEYLTPEEQANQKALRVDDVTATKDNIQGVAQALADGKMPTTGQITEAINSAQDSKALRSEVQLSSTGQRVADKVDRALDSTKQLVGEKNANNEIQKLIHHAKLAARNLEADGVDYSSEKKSSEQNLQHAYSNMVVLSQLVVTSSEFRGLLADLYNLVRDALRDNNVPYAEHLPSGDQITNKDGSINKDQVKNSANRAAEDAKNDAYSKLDSDSKQKLDQTKNGDSQHLADQAAQKLGQAVKPVADKAAAGNTQEAKEHVKGKYEETANEAKKMANEAQTEANKAMNQASNKLDAVVSDLKLTEEQQEKLADRFAAILDELQNNREARRAVNGLIEVLSSLRQNAETAAQKAKDTVDQEVDENKDLRLAAKNARRAVENFAGNHSLDTLFQLLQGFSEKVEKDQELRKVMHENRKFFNKVSNDPKFVHSKEFTNAAGEQFNQARNILLNKYQEPFNRLSREVQSFVTDLKEDPTTNRAISDLESLTRELFLDASGRPTIKFDLLQDFQKFIPVLSKRLERLEIPRVCEQDEDTEYILDNISLVCSNIVPKTVRVRTDTEFDTEEEVVMNVVSVKLQGIQAAAKEVAFYFKKKVAIIGNMEDAGLVDVVIDQDGMDVFLKLAPKNISTGDAPATNADDRAFRVLESKCRVNNISVKFQHTKYELLYKVFNKMIQSNIKRQIETQVSEGIRNFLEGVEQTVTSHNNSIDVGLKSNPLDTRPDGWKSDAFGAEK